MPDIQIQTNLAKFSFSLSNGTSKMSLNLKNPLNSVQSDTMIEAVGEFNNLLAGELAGIWYADGGNDMYTVQKISKLDLFSQTKTISEDGKTTTIFQQTTTIYEEPT